MSALPPGATIGILGGGQLGRMTALAAARLGYRAHIFDPDRDAPASAVAATTTHADYTDLAAVASFAAAIDVATYEFETPWDFGGYGPRMWLSTQVGASPAALTSFAVEL